MFPVQEFCSHLANVQPFYKALVKSGRFQENMELARGHFARGIERRLAELPRGQSIPKSEFSAIAHTHAGALLSLVTWWLDRGMRESPAEMDQLFHRLVWNGATKEYLATKRHISRKRKLRFLINHFVPYVPFCG